jgi:hypothetical protein
MDVSYIYFQDKHAIQHQWLAFSNPDGKDFNEITCYLRVSISVICQGDDQIQLAEPTGLGGAATEEIMMPPSIRKEYKQVKIRFMKFEKLPKMDTWGTIDAYVTMDFFKKKLKTKVVTQKKDTNDGIFDQEFWLPVQWPMATDRLVLKVFDEDKISDEIVGSMYFSLKKIINNPGPDGILIWKNLYGSPLGVSGAHAT